MVDLAQRTATVIVGPLKFDGFRVAFSVKKSLESNVNTADCSIWGLNETSRASLEQAKKPAFVIDAGYRDLRGVIFSGEAVEPVSEREPTGWVTRVHAADGHSSQRAIVNKTLGEGTTPGQVIKELADAMGVSSRAAVTRALAGDFNGSIGTFGQGITLTGSAKTNMDTLAKSLGLDWSIQDGELVVLKAQEVRAGEAVVISRDTGLLGSPQLVIDEKRPGRKIVRFKNLLNARINPGVKLSVKSRVVSGIFRTTTVVHAGDTWGSAWQSAVEAIELTGLVEV